MKKSLIVAMMMACTGAAFGQVRINEILINVPSPEADNTREFVEFLSTTPNASLAGYWLVVIDGDNNAAGDSIACGVVDLALNLSSYTTGANGLLLIRDAASPILQPAPSAQTSVVILNDFFGCGANNVQGAIDLENGSATYLIVQNFSGSLCQDLDTNNDGVLDATPWTSVVDAVGFINGDDFDNGIAAREYASQLGGIDVTDRSPGAPGFTADSFFRLCNFTAGIDAFGISSAPYIADPGELVTVPAGNVLPATFTLTPGNPNIEECTPVCVADVDDGSGTGTRDGGVGIEDLLYYLSLYDAGVSAADVDDGSGSGTPDGGVGIEDLLYYLARYDAGC